ncbi:thiol reductant ABC exporter subunit CydD [Allokutzneria albata]|uniref:ATP-binding cassette, subfamily C, CydCD n=1 Tax=Allokutzneria albata TaxID=211114 RepID=A0A1H0A7R8_ALLAB|nr:thiol reductant ABC exporter subunit CydD [Allokutzneria albata]SDN29003.1 ATP-binding cassette, subfamily C, CydCD [Allokutzneria albata]
MSNPAAPLPTSVDSAKSGTRGPLGSLPGMSVSARRALAVTGVLSVLTAIALVTQAWAIATALATVVAGGALDALRTPLIVLAGAVVARAALAWATEAVAARAAVGAKEELRARVLDSALARGPEWIAGRGPAELTALATRGLDALDAYFTRYLPALLSAVATPLVVGASILFSDWVSAVIIAVTIPLMPLFAILVGKHTEDQVARAADANERLSGHLLELVRALPVLTSLRRAAAQAEAVRRVGEAHRRATGATLRVAFASAFVLELIATISVAVVAVFVGVRLVSGDLTLAVGLFALILAPECYLPLRAAGAAHHASEDGVEAVRRVAEIDSASPATGTARPVFRHEVVVDSVRVERRGRYAPDGLSFTLRPGGITRLDLPSGAGKSTALGVLLGFVRPDSGSVTVDGTDLSTVDMGAWREQIAWVPQRPAFAAGTVAQELALAVVDPTAEELAEALDSAAALHLRFRDVDELSLGERQRVAIARALLRVNRGARILLLDEPTAHLDAPTAQRVMTAVREAARRGVAVLLAAHRTHEPAAELDAGGGGTVRAISQADRPHWPAPLRELITARSVGGALLGAAALCSGIALTAVSAWLIAKASQQPPILTLTVSVVAVRTFGIGRAVLRYVERLVSHDAAFRLASRLRVRLWETLVALGPARVDREAAQRLAEDTDTIRDLVPRVLVPPLVSVAVLATAISVEAVILPEAGLVALIALGLAAVLAPVTALAVERHASIALANGRREVSAKVLVLLEASADLISFGAHRDRRADLAEVDAGLAARSRRQALGVGAANAVIVLATGLTALAGIALGAAAKIDPLLVPVLALIPLATAEALALLPPAFQQFRALRVRHVHADTSAVPVKRVHKTSDGVRLHGVDVGWGGDEVLRDIDIEVKRGSYTFVVGESGSGKSTLLALLLGFLEPTAGRAELPERVAWCPQDAQLVSTTLRQNLLPAKPQADDEELKAALQNAGMSDWTERLDVLLGAGGAAVSGGEAQRIALARMLLAADDADLVLLDEPTSHLDERTADEVLERLRTTLEGRTVVHVTHRLDDIRQGDTLIEVTAGRVLLREPVHA